MNQREAKRRAYRIAAEAVRQAMLDKRALATETLWIPDWALILVALAEISVMLESRGGTPTDAGTP